MSAGIRRHDTVVIGAGPAGLGMAAELKRRGIEAAVLERTDQVGASWRKRYPSLRLNNDRWSARLPRSSMRGAERWPTRDEFIAYLERYAERHEPDIHFGVRVQRVDRAAAGWRLTTSMGLIHTPRVVVCTGHDRLPKLPNWPGVDGFRGQLLHAAEFQHAKDFAQSDVLVVGVGTSATEIATRLAEKGAKRVRVAVRTPPNLMPEEFLGVPITAYARLFQSAPRALVDGISSMVRWLTIGDLNSYGLGPAPFGVATELAKKGMGPVVDRGFVAALKAERVELVAALEGFDGNDVVLTDGTSVRPEVVIAATGYHVGLEEIVGHLGVLGDSGKPANLGASTHLSAPGLHFCGYRLPLSGELSGMRRDAKQIAKAIARGSPGPTRR